jgi:hypothetical protein
MGKIMIRDCDLLVCSSDGFLAESLVTIEQIKRLGLAELFDIHLLVGDQHVEVDGVQVLNRKHPGTWSSELKEGLDQLQKTYVLLWLDDFPPLNIYSIENIRDYLVWLSNIDGNYLRLNPTPAGHGKLVRSGIREILPGEIYRTSTIYSVWRRTMLQDLLNECESAWQFELQGSSRSDHFNGFYASEYPLITGVNLVVKGLVDPRAERTVESLGISLSSVKRRRMTTLELNHLKLKELRSKILNLFPWRMRRFIRNRFATNLRSNT